MSLHSRYDRFFRPPCALVIDDEEGIRYALGRLLEASGWKVHPAANGGEALEALEKRPLEIALIICDFKMPGMDGIETLTLLHQRDPDALRVLLTGYATLEAAIEATNQGLDAFITKPYQVRELRAKLDDLLARQSRHIASHVLGNVALFQDVPAELLAQIYPALKRVLVPRGQAVQELGEVAERLFIVAEGEVVLEARMPDGRLRPLAHLGPGEHFGELAMAQGERSPLRAVASLDTELMALERPDFERLNAQHPKLAEAVARTLTRRLHRVVAGPRRAGLVIAVEPPADHPAAPRLLVEALRGLGANAALLEGGTTSVTALRQQHRVVVATVPAQPEAAEKIRGQSHRAIAFVREGGRYRAEARPLHEGADDHHFSLSFPAAELAEGGPGMRGLARRLLGASFGLALGAGNARGVAHMGVLRALARAGLEIDALAGCSIGAVIGGFVAAGHPLGDAERFFLRFDLKRLSESRMTLGKAPWEMAREILFETCGGRTFEDAALPFLCNATDLERGAIAVFEEGPLAPAICASMATPPLFPPYYFDGHAYADGGLVNGLPSDLLLDRNLDLVAAVDVLDKQTSWRPPGEPRGGWMGGLFSGLPALVRYASMVGLLERAVSLSIRELVEARFTSCDLTIRPETDATSGDWDPAHFPATLEAGEKAGEAAARDLLARQRELLARWK